MRQQPKFSMSHRVLLFCKLYVSATTACAMSPQHTSYAYTLLGSLQGPYEYTMATAWTTPSQMRFYFTLKLISHLFGTNQCVCKYLSLSLICYECVQFQLDIYEELAVVAHVLQTTQNLFISRCCFAEDGKEMYQEF